MSGLGGLLNAGQNLNSAQPNYTQLKIQTASQGLPIPIVYGAQKISGNILWYGDFQKHTSSAKGKGGGKGSGPTTYSASVIVGLAEGMITPAVANVIVTSYGIQSSGVNSALYTDLVAAYGAATIVSTTPSTAGTGTLWVNQGKTTLSAVGAVLMTGAPGQAPWSYLASVHPDKALNYPGTAYMAIANLDLGSAPDLPVMWLECYGNLNSTCSQGTSDTDPAQVIYDILTHPIYGAGFPRQKIDLASLSTAANSYQKYVGALGIGFSLFLNERRPMAQILDEWLTVTNTEAVWSEGLLKFIPYGDETITAYGSTYTPNTLPVANLTDEDFVDAGNGDYLKISRSDPLDAFNNWKIEILDRQYDYNVNSIESKDQAAIDQMGRILSSGVRMAPPIQAHFLANASMATMCLELVKNRALYVRNQYEFTLSWENVLIEPMDVVSLTSANMGLNGKLVRVKSMEEQDDGTIRILAEEFLPGVGWSVAYPYQNSTGYAPNTLIAPGSVNAPVIFEPPAVLCGAAGPQIWVVASGPAATWGGCNVWASLDGTTYSKVGAITGQGTQGVLTASVAAYNGTNPDNGDTLAVSLAESAGVLLPVPVGGAAQGLSLCYVDGELLAYQNETLTTANNYNLTGLYRGLYGSAPSAHGTGTQFALLSNANVFKFTLPTNTSLIGQTVYFKFQSFNVYGSATQDISTCTAFPYRVTGLGSQVPFTIQASASGTLSANQSVLRYIATNGFYVPAGLAGTVVSEGTAATATATFILAKNGTSFGTIAISPSGNVTLVSASQANFVLGDVLALIAPASPDPTLANMAFGIGAVKISG